MLVKAPNIYFETRIWFNLISKRAQIDFLCPYTQVLCSYLWYDTSNCYICALYTLHNKYSFILEVDFILITRITNSRKMHKQLAKVFSHFYPLYSMHPPIPTSPWSWIQNRLLHLTLCNTQHPSIQLPAQSDKSLDLTFQ